MSRIKLEGRDVYPAKSEGGIVDVFCDKPFLLAKARWVGDEEVSVCIGCDNKFNQLRRKHHCRQCGRVLCAKCCKEKVPLPHLGLEEPERVCDLCLPITELITKARSKMTAFQIEAANGISKGVQDPQTIIPMVELGGLQTLIYLTRVNSSDQVKRACASGLHTLATHQPLLPVLAEAGAIRALCSVLTNVLESQERLIVDGLSALMLFCKNSDLKARAIHDGALQPVLHLCGMTSSSAIALLAVKTLNLITEDTKSHQAIIESNHGALSKLLALTMSTDEQMQEGSLKTLAKLSMGTDWHRHKIIQEDFTSGKMILRSLKNRPRNIQVLCNVLCLVGNLATCEQDQASLMEYMDCVCRLMVEFKEKNELMLHAARAIANFAKCQQNAYRLGQHTADIVAICMKSNVPEIHYHGLRAVFYLLKHSTAITTMDLMKDGATEVFTALASTPGAIENIQQNLLHHVLEIAGP
ncbi:uncharacterized protein LOC110973147 [Acanthaster planci]|uniref:Uncharacterized protein LOC110973147 n=1 Tax=Acanthaster planci TaxID=133434 RepID=A0A8B7XF75_ACAPL|nr:uncharacterized protein LOC110973147 [Acanthaster planci]